MTTHRDVTALAVALLAAYIGQATVQLEVPWLVALQADDVYKVASGAVLVVYLALQWTVARHRRELHKLLGALAPAVLYAHASKFAYGYLTWLLAVYLGVIGIGLLHQPVIARRAKRLFTWWFVTHLALAVLLATLVGYHVLIALAYE